MTTAATRDLAWRSLAPVRSAAPASRPRHHARQWMGRPLAAHSATELRDILFALELTAYGHVTPSDALSRDELVELCGEVDAEMERRRGRRRAAA